MTQHPIDTTEPRQIGVRRRWKLARSTAPQTTQEAMFQLRLFERARWIGQLFLNLQEAQQTEAAAAQSVASWKRLIASLETHDMANDADHVDRARNSLVKASARLERASANVERLRMLRAANYHLPAYERKPIPAERMQDVPRPALPRVDELAKVASEVHPGIAYSRLALRNLEHQLEARDQAVAPVPPPRELVLDEPEPAQQQVIKVRAGRPVGAERLKSNLAHLKHSLISHQTQIQASVEAMHSACASKLTELEQAEAQAVNARQALEQAERNDITQPTHVTQRINAQIADDLNQVDYIKALTEYRRSCLNLNNAVGQRILP